MNRELHSNRLLGVTRSQAKMHEYQVPVEYHIEITQRPEALFSLVIGQLGELAAEIIRQGISGEKIPELQDQLKFAALFFDSYIQSKLNEDLTPYLLLAGAGSYYLLDRPGSASVLANKLDSQEWLNLDGGYLEDLLMWLLQADYSELYEYHESVYGPLIEKIAEKIQTFFKSGNDEKKLISRVDELRQRVYESGEPRHLLYVDIIGAVVRKKIYNSSWKTLPQYSGLPLQDWIPAITKSSFIKELWPSQHLLGQHAVLAGDSSVIQMPTSAGKTKASELIIRSAFLSNRANIAVIVAPFRALCHEIRNDLAHAFLGEDIDVEEVSDVTQLDIDFETFTLIQRKKILVLTPEKLFYILQHDKSYATETGLVIFDEGHQFDSGTRGVTYELLLTSLRTLLPDSVQKVLISAVISNAEPISRWLNDNGNIVSGASLNTTQKTVGFTSWGSSLGMIQFVDISHPENKEFFVPRVLDTHALKKKGRERTTRYFPEKNNGKDIALHLGLNLCPNGSVAVFCGTKVTAVNLCKRISEVILRGAPYATPASHSNIEECDKIADLYSANLGKEAPVSKGAKLGVFSHHANTPHGLRQAVEYSMSKKLIKFVICTSTLAQGVNLPLRYLIITSVYQAGERLKVRDFHNLIGRAGRSGMHTEGSILFADPEVYDKKSHHKESWRWSQVKELLDPENSEPCVSNIASIFNPLTDDRGNAIIDWDTLEFFRQYFSKPEQLEPTIDNLAQRFLREGATKQGISRQIAWRIKLVAAIESFLLTHLKSTGKTDDNELSQHLATQTLGYSMADSEDKKRILDLFQVVTENLNDKISSSEDREVFGRTMLGIHAAQQIKNWVNDHRTNIMSCVDDEQTIQLLVELNSRFSISNTLSKLNDQGLVPMILRQWISGSSFLEIHTKLTTENAWLHRGQTHGKITIEHIVQACENELAYEGSLLVGALCEFILIMDEDLAPEAEAYFREVQKRLKYGLACKQSIILYELGLSDRVIAQNLSRTLDLKAENRADMKTELQTKSSSTQKLINKYPAYYQAKLTKIIEN